MDTIYFDIAVVTPRCPPPIHQAWAHEPRGGSGDKRLSSLPADGGNGGG